MLLEPERSDVNHPTKQQGPAKLQLGLLVCGVLLLLSIACMQFAMLRGFAQLADNINSKSQDLDSLVRFGELQEPVQHLITRGSKLLSDPSTYVLSSLTNPWTAIQLLRHGVPYALSAEAFPGLIRLFDTLQSSQIKQNLQQMAAQLSKMSCTTREECNRTAYEVWGPDFQQQANEAYAWAKLVLDVWPNHDDEPTFTKVPEVRSCNSTDVWSDLVCTVEIATQHFDNAQVTRTAQRCIDIVQKLKGQRFVRQAFWTYNWRGQWEFRQPWDYTPDVLEILQKIDRGCRLFVS